jgi:hypothetical protein
MVGQQKQKEKERQENPFLVDADSEDLEEEEHEEGGGGSRSVGGGGGKRAMRVREVRGQHELLECDKKGAEEGWGVGGMSRSGEEGDEVVEEEEYVDVASWQREFDKMLRKERASYASGRLQVS